MLKVVFNTLNNTYPIFNIKKYNISCMLDTGANIPVWNGSLSLFKHKFKECNPIKTKYYSSIGGFGEGSTDMPVYKLSNFELTNGNQKFTFKELYIAVEENRKRNFDLLLTYSMFKSIHIIISPKQTNREIAFVTNKKHTFNTRITAENNQIRYTESYLQEFTSEDVQANYINKLIKQEKN